MGGSDDGAGYVLYTWYAKHCLLDDETAETTPKRYADAQGSGGQIIQTSAKCACIKCDLYCMTFRKQ